MGIEQEKERILLLCDRDFPEFEKEISCIAEERPILQSFLQKVRFVTVSLQKTIKGRLEIVSSQRVEEAAKSLSDISYKIKKLYHYLNNHFQNYNKVPRELYYLTDWFFGECNVKVGYLISYAETIGMASLQDYIKGAFEERYPEICNCIKEENDFYFIFITPDLKDPSRSLNWTTIFHEASHIIDGQSNHVHVHYNNLPSSTRELLSIVKASTINTGKPMAKYSKPAQEKLWCKELFADYLATMITGPCFSWRLLEDHYELSHVFEPGTHPNTNMRIDTLAELLEELDFKKEAGTLRSKQKNLLKGVSADYNEAVKNTFARKIVPEIKNGYQIFNSSVFLSKLTTKYGPCNKDRLLSDIREMKPVTLDPAVIFSLVSFDEEIQNKPALQKLIVDFIRVYCVSRDLSTALQ